MDVNYSSPDLDSISAVSGDMNIYQGQNISLTCHGNGYPHPQFTCRDVAIKLIGGGGDYNAFQTISNNSNVNFFPQKLKK